MAWRIAAAVVVVFAAVGCEEAAEGGDAAAGATVEAVSGRWYIPASELENAANNAVLNAAERAGVELSDLELTIHVRKAKQELARYDTRFTFRNDGTFEAHAGKMVIGTWWIEDGVMVMEDEESGNVLRWRYEDGRLVSVPRSPRGKPVRLTRRP